MYLGHYKYKRFCERARRVYTSFSSLRHFIFFRSSSSSKSHRFYLELERKVACLKMCLSTTALNMNNADSSCIRTTEVVMHDIQVVSHSSSRHANKPSSSYPSSEVHSHYGSTHTKISSQSPSTHHRHKHHKHDHSSTSITHTQSHAPDHSLAVLFTVTLITEAARGLLLPSLWPYFNSVGGTKQGYGLLVASYSLGRMISVIPVGHLCDDGSHLSHTSALVITSFIQAFGHLGYALCRTPLLLLASRMVVGFGSASTSIARAHITKTVSTERRTTVLAYMSGVQFIGFAVLPALGGWMSLLVSGTNIDENINSNENEFAAVVKQGHQSLFSEFTIAAWMLVLANIICTVFVLVFYKEPVLFDSVNNASQSPSPPANTKNCPSSSSHHNSPHARLHECEKQPLLVKSRTGQTSPNKYMSNTSSPPLLPTTSPRRPITTTTATETHTVTTSDITPIVTALVINLVLRGVLAQLEAISIPFLVEQFHVSYISASNQMTMLGLLGTAIYFSFRPLAVVFSDRALIAVGLLLVVFGSLPLSLPFLSNAMSIAVYLIFLGQAWCVAYPIGQTAVLALFSKSVDGRRGVAAFMGLFSASGAISPLVLSVVATGLWERCGREAVFGFMCSTVVLGLGLVAVTYQRLDVSQQRKG